MAEGKKNLADRAVPKKKTPGATATAGKPATAKTAGKPVAVKTTGKPATAKTAGKPATAKTAGKPATAKTAGKSVNGKGGKPAEKASSAKAVVKDVDGRGNAVTKNPASKGKFPKKPESHPWDKMKKGETNAKKAAKPVKEMRDFLYLLPKRTSAKSLAEALGFLDKKALEVWEEECVLEITTESGIITFEDIRESLEKEDKEVLSDLRMKQVLSCDYESTNAELVKKIMTAFLKAFGGKIGSDTEDFTPFLELEEL